MTYALWYALNRKKQEMPEKPRYSDETIAYVQRLSNQGKTSSEIAKETGIDYVDVLSIK